MPAKKKPTKPAKKINPIAKLPASVQNAMRNGAGWREKEVMKNAKRITIIDDLIKVDTGRKTGSPTDHATFSSKHRQWIG